MQCTNGCDQNLKVDKKMVGDTFKILRNTHKVKDYIENNTNH